MTHVPKHTGTPLFYDCIMYFYLTLSRRMTIPNSLVDDSMRVNSVLRGPVGASGLVGDE